MTLKWSSATDQLYAVSNSSPSLDLDFASNKSLLDNISGLPLVNHQRDASSGKSAGTYVGSDGLIKTSVVNLLTYSEEFISAAPSVLSPTGTANTKELSVGNRYASSSAVTAGNQYTFSIYVRSAGLSTQFTLMSQAGFTGDRSTIFNIIDGTLVSSGSGIDNYSITSFPNGWYRVSQTDTAETSASTTWQIVSVNSSAYIWGAQLEENSTASTYVPTTTSSSGAPRFDFHPVTGESLGLLIEESRTNSILWSEDFNNAAWAKVSVGTGTSPTVTSNYTTGPDGVSGSASRIQASITGSTANDISLVQQINTSTSDVYGSIWVKSNTGSNQTVYFRCIGDNLTNTETVTTEWTRLGQQSSGAVSPYITVGVRGTATGPASIDISVFGAQIEAGLFPTSYIPTTSSAVTRAADVAGITGTNFSSWYNQSEGSFFIDFNGLRTINGSRIIDVNGVSAPIFWATPTGIRSYGLNSGPLITADDSIPNKAALSYSTTIPEDTLVVNGTSASTATGFNTASNTTTEIYLFTSDSTFNTVGHISRLTYYPYRLSDTILQEITS
jgi:hypothetical protein